MNRMRQSAEVTVVRPVAVLGRFRNGFGRGDGVVEGLKPSGNFSVPQEMTNFSLGQYDG